MADGEALTTRRVALMRQLQARGAVRLDATVSLLGDYREDDERRRWRIVIVGIGQTRTFSGRTEEEALEQALIESERYPQVGG